ncbi:hypothetical protein D3C76_1723170 [compost metagenome]
MDGRAVGNHLMMGKAADQNTGDADTEAHRQLHHHRQQAVAAAGQSIRQIFQRQGVHGREAQ